MIRFLPTFEEMFGIPMPDLDRRTPIEILRDELTRHFPLPEVEVEIDRARSYHAEFDILAPAMTELARAIHPVRHAIAARFFLQILFDAVVSFDVTAELWSDFEKANIHGRSN